MAIYVWNRNELLHQDAVTRLNIPDGIYFAIISGKMLISISPSISPDMFITYIQQAKNNFQFLNSNIEVKIDIGYYNVSNDNIYNHIETLNDIYDYNMSHAYATNKKRRLVKSYKKEY